MSGGGESGGGTGTGREAERALVLAARAGDASALARVVLAHREQVGRLARRVRPPRGLEKGDVAGEAEWILVRAVLGDIRTAYDLGEGAALWPSVRPYILRRLVRLRDQLNGVAVAARRARSRVLAAYTRLEQELGGRPNVADVAAAAGVSEADVEEVLAGEPTLSDDLHGAPSGGASPGDAAGGTAPVYRALTAVIPPPARAQKTVVLLLLTGALGFDLKQAADLLRDHEGKTEDGDSMEEVWAACHEAYGLPPEVPPDWPGVVALFDTTPPPPRLSYPGDRVLSHGGTWEVLTPERARERSHDALRTAFARNLRDVRERGAEFYAAI